MLLATDLVDDDPTLFAACNFENDPIGFTGSTGAISEGGVFSPNSQYVVTFPLPYTRQKKEMKILGNGNMLHLTIFISGFIDLHLIVMVL